MDGGTDEQWNEDPGWGLNVRMLLLVVPQLQMRYLRRSGGDPLVMLRSLYISFLVSFGLFGVVLSFVTPVHGDDSAVTWLIALVVLALLVSVLVRRVEQPLSCESDALLAGSYRTRFFLRIAFANSIALAGFVGAFATNSSWVYFAGLFLALPGLLRAAPTRTALVRDQDDLTARGCTRSLVAVFRRTPPKQN